MKNKSRNPILRKLNINESTAVIFAAVAVAFGFAFSPVNKTNALLEKPSIVVIGHRGASGHTPEHTIHAYEMALTMGADAIEPDLVSTKDGVLIVRHENNMADTTNVATVFPKRKRSKVIDGEKIEGWFSEDFTLNEIKKLRAKERLPFRSQLENGKHDIPTFEEVLVWRANLIKKSKKKFAIVPELKHSTYFENIGLPLEKKFVALLKRYDLDKNDGQVLVQSFEVANLKKLKSMTQAPMVQLIDEPQMAPYDSVQAGKKVTYAEMVTPQGLKEIATYATWIGLWKPYVFPVDADKNLLPQTQVVPNAKAAGLKVVVYTFRKENQYLNNTDQNNPVAEIKRFFGAGIDAAFCDHPDICVSAKN
jgi:glycerophosphoryl diester phosphodiesterase